MVCVAQSIAEVHRLTQALEDEHQRAETEKASLTSILGAMTSTSEPSERVGTPLSMD